MVSRKVLVKKATSRDRVVDAGLFRGQIDNLDFLDVDVPGQFPSQKYYKLRTFGHQHSAIGIASRSAYAHRHSQPIYTKSESIRALPRLRLQDYITASTKSSSCLPSIPSHAIPLTRRNHVLRKAGDNAVRAARSCHGQCTKPDRCAYHIQSATYIALAYESRSGIADTPPRKSTIPALSAASPIHQPLYQIKSRRATHSVWRSTWRPGIPCRGHMYRDYSKSRVNGRCWAGLARRCSDWVLSGAKELNEVDIALYHITASDLFSALLVQIRPSSTLSLGVNRTVLSVIGGSLRSNLN